MQVFINRLVSAGLDFLPFLIGWAILSIIILTILLRLIRNKSPSRRSVIAGNILVFLLFFLVMLVPLETYFRYAYDATDNLAFLQTAARWRARHVVSNNQGFRDDDFSGLKKPGIIRIGILGDSFTYGQGIENREDLYADILERSLSQTVPVEIYNISREGLTTRDQISLLLDEKSPLAQYDFDLLLLAYVLNDFRGDAVSPLLTAETFYRRIRFFPVLKQIFDHSLAVEFLTFHTMPYLPQVLGEEERGAVSAYSDPVIWEEHKKTLATLIAFSKKTKMPLFIMLLPHMQRINDYPAIDTHRRLHAFFSANNLHVLDTLEAFRGRRPSELMVGRFDAHPNEKAHEIIAATLKKYLLTNNLIQTKHIVPSELQDPPLRKTVIMERYVPPNKLLQKDGPVLYLDGFVEQNASCLASLESGDTIGSNIKIAYEDRNGKVDAWTVVEDNGEVDNVNLNQKILEFGFSLPDLEEAPKEKSIALFIRMWRARMFNRGLWSACSWEEFKSLWGVKE